MRRVAMRGHVWIRSVDITASVPLVSFGYGKVELFESSRAQYDFLVLLSALCFFDSYAITKINNKKHGNNFITYNSNYFH